MPKERKLASLQERFATIDTPCNPGVVGIYEALPRMMGNLEVAGGHTAV